MKNLLNDIPSRYLLARNARLKFTLEFVKGKDITDKTLLDIGCGFGWFEQDVLMKGVKKVIGIEISEEDLKAVRTIQDVRAIFKVAGALKLPFKDTYFDTVVAWEVIEHIPKNTENKMFQEVKRVLKKKGTFYLSTPYDSFWSKYFDPAWWCIGHRHYSKENLIRFGKKNGFKVSELYIKGGWWDLINLLNLYISKWIFRRERFFEKALNKREEKEFKKNGFMGIFIKYEKK